MIVLEIECSDGSKYTVSSSTNDIVINKSAEEIHINHNNTKLSIVLTHITYVAIISEYNIFKLSFKQDEDKDSIYDRICMSLLNILNTHISYLKGKL